MNESAEGQQGNALSGAVELDRPGDRARADRRTESRMPSLLHDLLDYHLVTRTGDGAWVLTDDVQRLLERQAAVASPKECRVFVGLRCEACGNRAVTRLTGGQRICDSCAGQGNTVTSLDTARTSQKSRRRRPLHPFRQAG